jgi:hypothetical protein
MLRTITLLLALCLLAGPAAAAGPYFVQVTGAVNAYDMGRVNDFLDSVNEDTGAHVFEPLDGGGSWGAQLGRVYNRRLATSIGFERLRAGVESTPPPLVMTIHAPANVIRFQASWGVARLGPVIPFLQGGVGFIWTNGQVEYIDEHDNERRHPFSGSTICLEALAGLEVRLNDRFGLNVAGGWRQADIDSPEWDASSFGGYGTFTGPGFDYSGVVVRAGLRVRLNWAVGDTGETRDASEDATGWL